MKRRQFLTSTMLGMVTALPVKALEMQNCAKLNTPACQEIAKHAELLTKIKTLLQEKGLNEEEAQAILANSTCPFCSKPLI